MKTVFETTINNAFRYFSAVRGIKMFHDMQANKSYEDTNLHQDMIVNANSLGYTFDANDDRPERIIKTFFAGVSSYLSKRKQSNPDEAVALILTDTDGSFKFAGVVQFIPNDTNPDEPGSWAYTMTFYEDDIKDLEKSKRVKKLMVGDDAFKSIMDKMAYDIGGITFERETYIYDACLIVIDSLIHVLDCEAKAGEIVDIAMPGYFLMSVAVEGGEKVFSITPDEAMKMVIKSDIDLGA